MTAGPRSLLVRRRDVLVGAGACAGAALVGGGAADRAMAQIAVPEGPTEDFHRAREAIVGGRPVHRSRVSLDVPRIAESGNSVPLKVRVDSAMTQADHVRTIHILSEKNPYAVIARFHLSPRSGIAEVATHVRLATTQVLHALAETSDGAVHEATAETVVALAACLDGS